MLRFFQIRAKRRHNSHYDGPPAPPSHAECNPAVVHAPNDSDLSNPEKPCHKGRISDVMSGTRWTLVGFVGVSSGIDWTLLSFLFLIYPGYLELTWILTKVSI